MQLTEFGIQIMVDWGLEWLICEPRHYLVELMAKWVQGWLKAGRREH